MKFFIPLAAIPIIFLEVGCKESPVDTSFAVEVIDGIRHVHNLAPHLGETSRPELELLGKIGKLEGEKEQDILYEPVDAAKLPKGDILILERGACTVKRYDKNYRFISSFGKRDQGPGDFLSPYCLRLKDDTICVADSKISRFSLDGSYEGGFKPEAMRTGGSIGAQFMTSGMALLSGFLVILPSPPSLWADSGENRLLSVYDRNGSVSRSFGAVKLYDNPRLTLNANIACFAADDNDNIYVAGAYQNRIDKYSAEGSMIFSADRPLLYEIKNVMRAESFKSGNMEQEFLWPSVSSVTKGIGIDSKNRIWVLTFLKQPNRFLTFDAEEKWSECFEFDVFDSEGILLFKVPFPDVMFDNISVQEDRIYLIDFQEESCIYEYRIVEKNGKSSIEKISFCVDKAHGDKGDQKTRIQKVLR